MTQRNIPPTNIPLVDAKGYVSPAWYRWFVGKEQQIDEAEAGEVLTPGAGGLDGGGVVSDGVSLSIAANGVTNTMLRDSSALSVLGRFQNSAGDPADIVATADNRVLCRESNMLAFRDAINVTIGAATPMPGTFSTFRLNSAETASVATASTHKVEVNIGGAVRFLLMTDVP